MRAGRGLQRPVLQEVRKERTKDVNGRRRRETGVASCKRSAVGKPMRRARQRGVSLARPVHMDHSDEYHADGDARRRNGWGGPPISGQSRPCRR